MDENKSFTSNSQINGSSNPQNDNDKFLNTDVNDASETVYMDSNPNEVVPLDSLEMLVNIKVCFQKIIEELKHNLRRPEIIQSMNQGTVVTNEGQDTKKKLDILELHSDRIIGAKSFRYLFPYIELFQKKKFPDKESLTSYYIEELKKIADLQSACLSIDYEINLDEAQTEYTQNVYNNKQDICVSSKSSSCEIDNERVKMLSEEILRSIVFNIKEKLIGYLTQLKRIIPSNAGVNYDYHKQKILEVKSLNDIRMSNYCAIFDVLDKSRNWESDSLIDVIKDLELLKSNEKHFNFLPNRSIDPGNNYKSEHEASNPIIDENNDKTPEFNRSKSSEKRQLKKKKTVNNEYIEYLANEAKKYPKFTGVFYAKTCRCWVAQIPIIKGKIKQVYYSIKRYGFDTARTLAIKCREKPDKYQHSCFPIHQIQNDNNLDDHTTILKKSKTKKRSKKGNRSRRSNKMALEQDAFYDSPLSMCITQDE